MSNVNLTTEIRIIKYIAARNGYNENLIDRIIKRKTRNRISQAAADGLTPLASNGWVVLDYMGHFSSQIEKVLRRYNVKTAFRATNTLFSILPNPRIKIDNLKRSGVYRLTCPDCLCVYIGKTARCFRTRFEEHERAFRLQHPEASNFAKHLLTEGHRSNIFDDHTILHLEDNDSKLLLLESLEIRLANKRDLHLCNEQLQFPLSPIMDFLLNTLA
jgi:hypothetical protein